VTIAVFPEIPRSIFVSLRTTDLQVQRLHRLSAVAVHAPVGDTAATPCGTVLRISPTGRRSDGSANEWLDWVVGLRGFEPRCTWRCVRELEGFAAKSKQLRLEFLRPTGRPMGGISEPRWASHNPESPSHTIHPIRIDPWPQSLVLLAQN